MTFAWVQSHLLLHACGGEPGTRLEREGSHCSLAIGIGDRMGLIGVIKLEGGVLKGESTGTLYVRERGQLKGIGLCGGGRGAGTIHVSVRGCLITSFVTCLTCSAFQAIQWFRVEDLPRHKKDLTTRQNLGKNPNSFFMIMPFIRSGASPLCMPSHSHVQYNIYSMACV